MARLGGNESNPTEALLQNLLKRSDVRSTLILSRKDGSIIKAAGLIAKGFNEPSSTESTSLDTDGVQNLGGEQPTGAEVDTESRTRSEISDAQLIASSIYHFVASATSLGASLNRTDTDGAKVSANDQTERKQQNEDEAILVTADDIQLLRLRMAKQEVIIFPDPKYLCCVIQDLDKDSR